MSQSTVPDPYTHMREMGGILLNPSSPSEFVIIPLEDHLLPHSCDDRRTYLRNLPPSVLKLHGLVRPQELQLAYSTGKRYLLYPILTDREMQAAVVALLLDTNPDFIFLFPMPDYLRLVIEAPERKGVEVSIRLRRAVFRNDLALVQRILKTYPDSVHNADQTDKSNTSLHVAAREGFDEIAEFIVSFAHEQDLADKRSSRGHSYLSRKCAVGLTYNTDDQTPLHYAAESSRAKIAELLCKYFPQSIEKHDKEGRTPLHLASQAQPAATRPMNPTLSSSSRNLEDTSTLQVLLAHHADVRAVDKVGSTCLHYATAWGNLKAVRVLVQAGADPLVKNDAGWMPQYYSVTVQADVYFRNLVVEWEKRQAEEGMRHRQRIEAERGGVRLVSEEDEGTEGTESDDGRNRADSGSTHFTTASEGDLGLALEGQIPGSSAASE